MPHASPLPFYTPDTALFLLSAPSQRELHTTAQALGDAAPAATSLQALADAWAGRADPQAPSRAALVAGTPLELKQRVTQLLTGLAAPGATSTGIGRDPTGHVFFTTAAGAQAPRVGLLFPGQGSQRLNMGRALVERFPWAERMLAEAEQVLTAMAAPAIGARMFRPWGEDASEADTAAWQAALAEVEVAGPAIICTAAWWTRYLTILGVVPAAVCGHSQGEQAAFHAAGGVPYPELVAVSAYLGRAGSPRYNPGEVGTMAVLSCAATQAQQLLAEVPGDCVVANVNGPAQVVIAGPQAGVAAAVTRATALGIDARPLAVSNAFHSRFVTDGTAYMRREGPAIAPLGAMQAQLISCVDGRIVAPGTRPLDHFCDMARGAIDFAAAVHTLTAHVDLLIEAGPGRVLSGLVPAIAPELTCLPIEPVPGRSRALHAIGAAWFGHGVPLKWDIYLRGLTKARPA